MEKLKYLTGALPITGICWYLLMKTKEDFVSNGEFYFVAGILSVATAYIVVDVVNTVRK